MNWKAGVATGLFAFVLMLGITTFIMGKSLDMALMYSLIAVAMLGPSFAYFARDITADVSGATPRQAADLIGSKFKVNVVDQGGGVLQINGGANFFWSPVVATPSPTGVTLRGPGNILTYMKANLEKR